MGRGEGGGVAEEAKAVFIEHYRCDSLKEDGDRVCLLFRSIE